MKTRIEYIAPDDTIFESKEMCEKYERNLHCLFMRFMSNVQFYDDENNRMLPIPNRNTWNNDMYYDELYDIYNKSKYLYIRDNLTTDISEFNRNNYGFIIPEEKGRYKYNDIIDKWEKIEESA